MKSVIIPNDAIGAGAVVVDDIREAGAYVGVAAKKWRRQG